MASSARWTYCAPCALPRTEKARRVPRRSPDRYSIPGSDEFSAPEGGVPQFTGGVQMAAGKKAPQALRYAAMLAGVLGFAVWALLPELPVAVDPEGRQFVLDKQARLALGLFVLAAVWWVFEVVPVGITAITIAVVQALFR